MQPSSFRSKVVFDSTTPKRLSAVQFHIGNASKLRRLSHLEIVDPDIYSLPSKKPVKHGVNDQRLGVSTKVDYCTTCGFRLQECEGHFGYVNFTFPCFHIGYMKCIIRVLQKICKRCSRVLLSEDLKLQYLAKFGSLQMETESVATKIPGSTNLNTLFREHHARKLLNLEVKDLCEKVHRCSYCGSFNGKIRKITGMKIIHEKYRGKTRDGIEVARLFRETFADAGRSNPDIVVGTHLARAQEDMTPMVVLRLFRNIPPRDVLLLDMNPELSRPEDMIWTHMLVPPCAIRPSVPTDDGTNEDDLTTDMSRIVLYNQRIREAVEKGDKLEQVLDMYDELHFQTAQFIDSGLPGFAAHQKTGRRGRSLVQRLKGKHGRFRGNLSGKRVDFSARSPISPDPNIDVDQVGIPVHVAKRMTFPTRVTPHNIDWLRKMIINGHDKHPGAYFLTYNAGMKVSFIHMKKDRRVEIAKKLRIGEIVERHMVDDDLVLFNRQPSLHRISIMAHRVKVLPYNTFRLNLCACTPYNADFDGDEMNVHFPQTLDAKAEAGALMSVVRNLCTPRNGEAIISAIQDFITASFLLTGKDSFFPRDDFCQLIAEMDLPDDLVVDIPRPAILKPVELWTGKQLMRVLLKPTIESDVRINLETMGRNYSREGQHLDVNDSYVAFRNSHLVSGTLDKKILGPGGKTSLFFILIRNYGAEYAAECMSRLAKVSARWLGNRGFSIGIDDVTPTESLLDYKKAIIEKEMEGYRELLQRFRAGELKADPGCTVEQTFESKLNLDFSNIRSSAGKLCFKNLHPLNALAVMARSGSKGGTTNIAQMIALVGQQSVGGNRIENGFLYRTLPHFPYHDRSPKAKGFVSNSFYSGLSNTEFFFHTMGGREGLVDTAVKTAETGYMQRRLMKALEDLTIQYDGTLRNSENVILQFRYGDDSLDPLLMEEEDGRPLNFSLEMMNAKNWARTHPHPETAEISPRLLHPSEAIEIATQFIRDNSPPPVECVCFPGASLSRRRPRTDDDDDDEGTMDVDEEEEEEEEGEGARGRRGPLRSMKLPGTVTRERPFTDQFGEDLLAFLRVYLVGLEMAIARATFKKVTASSPAAASDARVPLPEPVRIDSHRLRESELTHFLRICREKYVGAMAEPGEAMGALAGQSIGEPGTQMTLKTFHFAGVASMNITLGVPRILEIINASKSMKTPIITAQLEIADEEAGRIIKGRVERTTLGQISRCIVEIEEELRYYIRVELDRSIMDALFIQLPFESIRSSIMRNIRLLRAASRLAKNEVFVRQDPDDADAFFVDVPVDVKTKGRDAFDMSWYTVQRIKEQLKDVIVSGIPSVTRAIVKRKKDSTDIELLAEGRGLLEVMGTAGVDPNETVTNNILEVEQVLGIEAARELVMKEIKFTMGQHGIGLDERHLKLVSDLMTFKGDVLGINRHGVLKMKSSPFLNASFERTADHLFNAAVHTIRDDLKGVSESIIVGNPMPLGTGMVDVLHQVDTTVERRETLF